MSNLFIFLALGAQLINAAVTLADKYLVTSKRALGDPLTYAFYVSLLSGVVAVLLPFGVVFKPTAGILLLSFYAAVTFVASLVLLYGALRDSDASDVAPAMGAITAIATLLFSFLMLGERLSGSFLSGFILLTAGTALMSYFRFNAKTFWRVLVAGLLFGLSGVIIKMLFLETTFIDGFFWSRMANVAAALLLLLWPGVAARIKSSTAGASGGAKVLVIGNKALAGVAFFMILYAISIGSVSVVNALAGSQFLFLLILALIFTKKMPDYLFETVHRRKVIGQKVAGTLLIFAGLLFLFT